MNCQVRVPIPKFTWGRIYDAVDRWKFFASSKGFQSDITTWKLENVEMCSQPEDCQEYSRDLQYQILMFHNHKTSRNY